MKSIVLACLFALMAVAYAMPDSTYTDRYDNIDLDGILTNRRLLAGYIKCTLDQGKCTPEGKELKAHLKEGIEQNCAKCTPAQRSGTRQVLAHLINNEPEYWNQLKAKYDSTGRHSATYELELKKH